MALIDDLLATILDGAVVDVSIGLHWTAVVAVVAGEQRCGLASTLRADGHGHGEADVPRAGQLTTLTGKELAALALASTPTRRSIGFAALNALLPRQPEAWLEANASDVIVQHGAGKTVAMVGHFPFTDALRAQVGALHVLELNPGPGDLPADAAGTVLPQADVVAITSMSLLNGTFDELVRLCRPDALVLALGPTTPLSPVMFDYSVKLISGAVVEDIGNVLRHVRQGGNFRQVRRAGVRLVNIRRE